MMYLAMLALCLPAVFAQYPPRQYPPYSGGYGNPCYPFGPYRPFNPYYPNDPNYLANAQCGQRNSPCSLGTRWCCFGFDCSPVTSTCQDRSPVVLS